MTQCERDPDYPCENTLQCCDCGGVDCGCPDCWTCNACEVCREGDV